MKKPAAFGRNIMAGIDAKGKRKKCKRAISPRTLRQAQGRPRAGGLVTAHPCGGGRILITLPLIALADFVTL